VRLILSVAFTGLLAFAQAAMTQTGETRQAETKPHASGSGQPLAFDAVTIKPVDQNVMNESGVRIYPGGRTVIGVVNLKTLISIAFDVGYSQISGCNDWCESANFNVEAKPPDDLKPPISNLHHSFWEIEDTRLRQMLQSLLVDRFRLRVHPVSQIGTVYVLQRNGKLIPLHAAKVPQANSDVGTDARPYEVEFVGGTFYIINTSMPELAQFASKYAIHHPVLDQTELIGFFDYKSPMQVDPETQQNDFEASFLQFLSEIGLELKKETGPVQTIVVDHAERPSPN
jgi:uncharacterized protein (TIGR03435 family)